MIEDALAAMPLLSLDERGNPPVNRLRKASVLRSVHMRFREDDLSAAENRARTQDLLDGGTPYDQVILDRNGMSDTTNLNFGGAEQSLERAMAPYYTMVNGGDAFISVSTLFGAEDERPDLNAILAEELSRTMRDWEGWPYQTARLAHKHVWDGVGVLHWPDTVDWRFRTSGLGQFYFPRQSLALESEMEIVTCIEEYTVTRLFAAIENEEIAVAQGWTVAAVKDAIRKATTTDPIYQDWERLSEEIKNNDLAVANNTPVSRVITGFVREFDGTVSIYLTTEEPGADPDAFLCVGRSAYRSMREAFVMFPYGLGTNTKVHGIRGLGFKIYAFEQQRNRSLSRLIDQGTLSSSLMLQAPDEESLANVGLQYYGNTAVIDPNCKVVQYAAPDIQRTVMPVLQEMERLRNDRTGSYSSEGAFDGDQRKTKFEIDAKLQQDAVLSNTAQDFWYGPFERGIQQTVRRIARRTYLPMEPGGREVADLHLRLTRRGVPLEALFMLDINATRVLRAIGSGSASAQTLALARISDLRPRMDDVAQANLDRALAINAVGVSYANIFFPPTKVRRTTVETSIAILQNGHLTAGMPVPVLPSDNHLAHAREHMKPLMEMFQAVEQGQLPIEQGAQQTQLLYNHAAEHVTAVSGDPAAVEEAAMLRQALQQIGEVISNGLKKAQAAQAAEAKAQQEGAGEGMDGGGRGQLDPKAIAEFERHKAAMQFAREKHELEKQIMLDNAATKRQIADADEAAKILRSRQAPQSAKPKQ